jgi:hypothetical protein
MIIRHGNGGNSVSEIPCRLIDDVHEWCNEISTVPNKNPPNSLFWCKSQRIPVGSEDPVKLYCSLLLRREL